MKNKWKDSADYWRRKLTLKTQNLISRADFKSDVEMPKFFCNKKVLFTNSIKLWFDAEVAVNFLNGIYCLGTNDHQLTLRWEMLLKSTYCDPLAGLVVMVKGAFL